MRWIDDTHVPALVDRGLFLPDLKSEFKKAKGALNRVRTPTPKATPTPAPGTPQAPKVKMSMDLVSLLVYTVGVKCRGLNKKEEYAPEHIFSLSENTLNKLLKQSTGMMDLIKHNRTHLVRTYPKGTRIGSTNYEPHRYWSAGCHLVAINWQTFGAFGSTLYVCGMLTCVVGAQTWGT